jgi:hypothetical protein
MHHRAIESHPSPEEKNSSRIPTGTNIPEECQSIKPGVEPSREAGGASPHPPKSTKISQLFA